MTTEEKKPTNFIRHIIDADLAANKNDGRVATRFPPEPNGYLHIGHAKSICLNFGIAEDYQGTCNLRFDDTNPHKENVEFVESIQEDVHWLGYDWDDRRYFASDYFEQLHDYAVELIKAGKAYICDLDAEQVREYRGTLTEPGKASPGRSRSVEENLDLFARMRAGEFEDGAYVLRAKIDMTSPNMNMRDPTLYRIRHGVVHHQTGEEWCIYPMYDFAHCISDAIENITHSLCTLEFQDNRRLYDWVLDNLNDFNKPDRPHQYEFSRLNLEYTVMSKRKLHQLVDDNLVSGWDDPRMPTISGLRRRGYTAAALRDFAERIGISKVDSMTGMDILEASIRDDLNKVAPRTMAVMDPIKVVIENYDGECESIQAPIHPQNEAMGKREIFFGRELYIDRADFEEVAPNGKFQRLALDKEVRLRNAYIVKAVRVDTDAEGNFTTIYCTYDPETLGKNPADGRKVKGVIHFVEASKALPAVFRIYDRLFSVENPVKADDFESVLNTDSLAVKQGFVEPGLANSEAEKAYQFEREGYFCRDNQSGDVQVYNRTVALRDTWGTK